MPTVADSLRLGAGFQPDERDRMVDLLGRLDERMRSLPDDSQLELSMKERGEASQRTVLSLRAPGWPHLVGTSAEQDLQAAVIEVRNDLVRQISDQKNSNEPRNRRSMRETHRR
jgi:ribosome-associated translation inhibitor RaiA